jgi:uncharacterized cupin superfamily protein
MKRTLSFIYLHDNHTATFLTGKTLDEILDHARRVESEHTWGCLCPVTVMEGTKEVRQVGPFAHSHGTKDREYWRTQLDKWRAEVAADTEVMRILEGRNLGPTYNSVCTVSDLIKLLSELPATTACLARDCEGHHVPLTVTAYFENAPLSRVSHLTFQPT